MNNWYYWIVLLGAIAGCIIYGVSDNICHFYIWTGVALLAAVTSWMSEIKNLLKELLNELRKFNNINVKINKAKE